MIVLIAQVIAIGLLGAILFLAVDKYERDYLVGNVLKLFVLTFGCLVVLRKLLLVFGVEF